MYYPDLRFICEKRQRKTKRTTSKAQSNGDQKDKQEDQNEEPVLMELLCHRVVIASRCPVWKPIINQYSHYHEEGQAEQVQSRQMLLDLFVRDIEFEVLLLLVDYFYSDRLSWNNADKTQRNKDEEKDKETEEEQDTKTTISDDDDVLLRKLMEVARRYQLKGLLDQCLLAWESKIMKNPYQQWHQTEEVRKKKQGGGEEKKDDKKNEKREFARKINEYVSQRSLEHLKRHKDVAKSLSLEPTEQAVLENALLEDDTRIERLKQQRTKEEDEKKINKEENHNDGFGLPWRLSYEELVANEPNFIVTKNYIDGIVNARKKMSTDAETTSKEEAEEEANEKEEQPAVSVPRSNDGWTIVVNTLSYDLQRYVNNADCADVVFFVEGQRLYAHKAILCARSSHFRALFTSGMKESTSGEIEIADISYETFLSLLMYFYTGYTNITEETVVELMMIANLYSALQLQEQCESFVEDGILVDNVTYLLEMAERFQTHHLRCVAMDYLLQYVKGKIDVTQLEGFSSLKPEILDEFRRGETYAANCEVIGPKTGFINKALHLRIAARDVFNFLATKGDEKWEVSIRILRGEEEKRAQQLIEEKKAKRREKMDQKERLIREAKGHPVPIAEQQDRQRVLEGEKEKQVGKDKEQMELKDEDKEKEIDEEQQKGQEDQPETDLTNEKEKKAESEKFGSKGFEFAFKPTDGKDISQNASLPPPFSLPSPSKALTAAFPSSSSSSSPSSALFSRPKQNVNDKSAVSKRRIYSARRHKASASSSLPSSSNRTTPTTTSPSASASPSQETIEDGLHEVDNRPLSNDTYEPSAVLLTKNNPIVNDGYYTLSFTPRFIGIHELSIRLFEKPDTVREGANAQGAWKHVKGSPFPLVVEKPVCGCKCKAFFTVNGQRQCTVRAGKEVNVTIEAHGLNGERVTVGRSIFAVYVYMDEWEAYQAKNHGVADVQIKDYKDGTYKGTFKLRGAGDYVVRVTHGKITLTTYPTYSVTPQKEKHYPLPGVLDLRCVPAPPFAPKCSACGDGLQVGVIGQPATFTIHARDKYDNKPEGWQELRVRVRLLLNKRYPSFIPLRTVEQSVLAQVAEEKQKKEQEEAQKKKDEEERRKRKEEEDKRRGDQRRGISDQEQRKRKKAEAAESRFNYLKGIAKSKKEKSDKRKEQLAAWEEEVKRHTIAEWDVITTCNQDIIYVPPENILELIDTKKNQLAEEAQKIKEERAAEEAKTVLTNEDKEKTEESTEKLTTATNTSSGSAAQSDTTEEKREAVQAEAEVEEKQSEDEPIHCVLSVSILDANGEDQGPIQDSPFSLLLFKPEQTTQFLAFQQQQKRQQQKLFTVTAPSFAFSSSSTSSSTSPRPLGLSTSFSSISSSPSLFSSSALTASSPSLPTSTPMFASPPLSSSSSSFTSPFYSPSFASPFTSGTLPSSIASPPIPPAGNTARPFASTSPFFSGTTASITPQQPTNQPFSFFAPSSSSSLSSAPFSFSSPSSASSLPTPSSSFTLPLSTPSSSSLSPVAPPFAFPILSPPSSSASVAVGVLPTTTTDSDGDDSSTESNHNHQQQP
ncbi:BTB/POZ domain-containing protein 7 [Balamuthia mandrillaris]